MDIIRKFRMLIGMTQKEFGEVIGVKQQTVCKYERADSNVSLKVLQKISEKFAIPVEELIEGNLEKYSSQTLLLKNHSFLIQRYFQTCNF